VALLSRQTEEAWMKTQTASMPPRLPTDTPTPEELQPFITDEHGVRMALIPGGEFQMGSDADDSLAECEKFRSDCQRDWFTDEEPMHTVYLDTFYMDVYEVTNALFAEFLNELGNQEEGGVTWLDADSSYARIHSVGGRWQADAGYEDHPVVEVNWYGARAFCEWRGARLPTEAEWEKAARGGLADAKYPWGNEAPVCNDSAKNGAQFYKCVYETIPVGGFAANGYGLFDIAGNVWEWVQDWYMGDYYNRSQFSNPTGPNSGQHRVARGGAWSSTANNLRVAERGDLTPNIYSADIGFRCARSP